MKFNNNLQSFHGGAHKLVHAVTKVMDRDGLPAAVKLAFEYDDQVIMEECISGFEVGCAVLGNDVLTVGEVSAIHVPARITANTAKRVKQTAMTIYKALGCQVFARVDMFLTPSGEIVFNEVNTITGFTTHSRFPNMLKTIGISFGEVIAAAIELAVRV